MSERMGIAGAKLVSPFLTGNLSIYKPIHVSNVAKAIVELAMTDKVNTEVLIYNTIIKLALS